MNKKLFIVIGKPNSGKSSLIRNLTGCRDKKGNWKISMETKLETFYVKTSSPQEQNRIGISTSEMVNFLLNLNEEYIILALQSESCSSQPNGNIYLSEFIKAGFNIQTLVSFDKYAELENLSFKFFETKNTPSNETAIEVRKLWKIK